MIYVGLPRYTEEAIDKLVQMGKQSILDGIILGDLTCSKRMFPYGGSELISIFSCHYHPSSLFYKKSHNSFNLF